MLYAPGRLLSPIAGGAPPSLDLNFLLGTMPDGITFSRASTAWGYNSSGVLTSFATNAPVLDYNPATLAALGLRIEEARTNIALWSEDLTNAVWTKTRTSVSANAVAAPDGATTADKLTEATDVATNRNVGQNVSVTSGTTYTLSVFAKAAERTAINLRFASGFAAGNVTFDLSGSGTVTNGGTVAASSIAAINGGWYRCSASFVATSSTTAGAQVFLSSGGGISYNGVSGNGVYLWGAQVEAGFATSYIPTTTVAVTRAQDTPIISALGSWFNVVEGAGVAEFLIPTVSASLAHVALYFDDGTSNERMGFRASSAALGLIVLDGGVTQATLNAGTVTSGTVTKGAFRYALNDFASCKDGGTVVTDTSGTLPTVTRMTLGFRLTSSDLLNGYLRRVKLYDRRLPDVTLQVITS